MNPTHTYATRALAVALLLSCAPACAPTTDLPRAPTWTDFGTVLTAGDEGAWDYYLWGGFAGSAVERDGVVYFYYQGSAGYDEVEGTVTGRAIGLATSLDGLRFTKHEGNPVVTWSPQNMGEEGAASAAVTLTADGEFVLFYGANTAISQSAVNADGRLATSTNGTDFTDHGVVLAHDDPAVWGSGDELFPVAAVSDANRWIVYYIPNGSPQRAKLGVAWGERRDALTRTAAVRDERGEIAAWGYTSPVVSADGNHWLFLSVAPEGRLEARGIDPTQPDRLGRPAITYRFEEVHQAVVRLDRTRRTWFMYYYSHENRYGVKLAPAGQPDLTPPTRPTGLTIIDDDTGHVRLRWGAADDVDTGVAAYRILRDGTEVGETLYTTWTDEDDGASAEYRVAAVNYHGIAGQPSDPAVAP